MFDESRVLMAFLSLELVLDVFVAWLTFGCHSDSSLDVHPLLSSLLMLSSLSDKIGGSCMSPAAGHMSA